MIDGARRKFVQQPADMSGLLKNARAALQPLDPRNPLQWTEAFQLTKDEADAIADPEWIEPGLIVKGRFIVIASEPNGGKTTVFMHLAGAWAKQGYTVIYVNADVSAADAEAMIALAESCGFQLLLPDMKVGLSMADVVRYLEEMANTGRDFSRVIMIFDTLKKMTDVINKNAAKATYRVLRSLSAKGMTVICLAHTNKYRDQDGMPIYEGTGDLRADTDELVYLIPQKHEDGSMTVSTRPDKVRAALKRYAGELWGVERGFQRNAFNYQLLPAAAPPEEVITRLTGKTGKEDAPRARHLAADIG
jgi:archaellum biogenesis ATPase FlaH